MAIQFTGSNNGTTDSGQLTGSATNAVTYSMWLRLDADLDTYSTFWATQGDGGWVALITGSTGTGLRLDTTFGATGWNADPAGFLTMTVGAWYYIAFVHVPGTALHLYYAEEGDTALTELTPFTTATSDWNVAYGTGIGVFPFFGSSASGSMAHYREWSAALTESELEAELVSATAVRTANLNREWRFESGSLFADSSGASHPVTSSPYRNGTGGSFTADPTIGSTDTDLVVADATSASTADAVTLTQAHAVTVADATSSSSADAAPVTQAHALTVADATSSSSADPVTLGAAIDTALTVADATSSSSADTVSLTQAHTLTVADATSASRADFVNFADTDALTIANVVRVAAEDRIVAVAAEDRIVTVPL